MHESDDTAQFNIDDIKSRIRKGNSDKVRGMAKFTQMAPRLYEEGVISFIIDQIEEQSPLSGGKIRLMIDIVSHSEQPIPDRMFLFFAQDNIFFSDELSDPMRLSFLNSGIPESTERSEELWNGLKEALEGAFAQFVETRQTEGENLKKDILSKLDILSEHIGFIEERSPQIVTEYRAKLEDKMKELLADTQIEESRIASEVILFADKICTDEEVVRLKSHISHMRNTLEEKDEIGRKLDFIAQEMNREANTILSKANDIEVSDHAISLKTEIEKIREQIQNIE